MTRCVSNIIWIPKKDVVEGVVRENVSEDVGGEENRLLNVFLLYSHQNQ
jgi:hypothetical protein